MSCLFYFSLVGILLVLYRYVDTFQNDGQTQHNRQHYPSYEAAPRTDNCHLIIQDTLDILSEANMSVSCSPLAQQGACQSLYDEIHNKADPFNVFLRSSSCDLDMPKFSPVSNFELEFPLAYFITAFKDPRNLELMLKSIFRPHNAYCIHVDPKADELFRRTVQQILHCYKQKYPEAHVFRSSQSIPVFWGHFSIVEAEMICLSDLMDLDIDWKYAVNMAGSELMLFTNKELVRNLSASSNSEIFVESFPMPEGNMYRVRNKFSFDPSQAFDPDHAGYSFLLINIIKYKDNFRNAYD